MLLSFPNGEHRAVRIEPGCLCVGSAADNELVIAHPGLADRHACIISDRRGLVLEVEPGVGDVHVNGRPVQRRALLRLGDVVHLGGLELRLSSESSLIRIPPPRPTGEADDAERALADAQAAPRVVLRGITGEWFGRLVVLRARTVVGRDPDCELRIDDPELSRRHAQIENTSRGLILRDLDSANGTFVNGVQVRDAVLAPGDQISFDIHRFVLEAPGYQARPSVPEAGPAQAPTQSSTRVVPVVRAPEAAAPAARALPTEPEASRLDESVLWWAAAAIIAVAAIAAVLLMN